MQNLVKLFEQIKTMPLRITESTKGNQIQQTERNALKQQILAAIFADAKENYEFSYRSEDGILFEVENDAIADKLDSETGSGAITIALDVKILGLDHNAVDDANEYEELVAIKNGKKAEREKKKAAKIERDKKRREAKEE